jgi:processive 1,2-diacylglycerol beta-glucosyltransferase
MKILGLSSPSSGCGFHRVILPLGFMNDTEAFVTNFPSQDRMHADLLLYNRISIFDNTWKEFHETAGMKVVIDLDDYWKLPPNHPNYHDYERMAERIENNIREADMVTVTNEELYKKVRPLNDNVRVFPNALPYGEHQFKEGRCESERVRIFWAGGSSHEADLRILKNPLQRLVGRKDIEMVMGGYMSHSVWDRMYSYFTAGGKIPGRHLPGTLPEAYMPMYEHADIMLVPLEESEWHACKSNLKLLEAACKRIPVICSKVLPYSADTDAPVLWVEKQSDWFKHISYLVNSPEERERLGNALYDWATKKYNLKDVNERRRAAFEGLTGTQTHLRLLPEDGGAC